LNYLKKLKDVEKEGAGAVALGAASALVGGARFDEVTGDVYVTDLLAPELRFKIRLLRVY
jgi:hypothetical protein